MDEHRGFGLRPVSDHRLPHAQAVAYDVPQAVAYDVPQHAQRLVNEEDTLDAAGLPVAQVRREQQTSRPVRHSLLSRSRIDTRSLTHRDRRRTYFYMAC